MLANFLIGLREGLEASLVVGILIAYLARTGHRRQLAPLWTGIAAAVVLSVGFGALLNFSAQELADNTEELFSGALGIVAVAFVTYMVFWMRRSARHMKGELEGKLSAALTVGAFALASTAFVAVAREGLETALFLWSNISNNTGSGPLALTGALLGIVAAVAIEYLLYRRSVRINLGSFFLVTGALLVVVAAGVLSAGVHGLQEAGVLPGADSLAFDVSGAVPENSWYGVLLKGIVGFRGQTTWLMVVAWTLYVVPVLTLFLRPGRPLVPRPQVRTEASAAR